MSQRTYGFAGAGIVAAGLWLTIAGHPAVFAAVWCLCVPLFLVYERVGRAS